MQVELEMGQLLEQYAVALSGKKGGRAHTPSLRKDGRAGQIDGLEARILPLPAFEIVEVVSSKAEVLDRLAIPGVEVGSDDRPAAMGYPRARLEVDRLEGADLVAPTVS